MQVLAGTWVTPKPVFRYSVAIESPFIPIGQPAIALATAGLTLLAALSPLLTFAALWQVKEWRWDRLLAYFREQGFLRKLFGLVRPAVVAGTIAMAFVMPSLPWLFFALVILAGTSVLQMLLRRQPVPVATQKALAVITLALVLTIGLCVLLPPTLFPALVLGQPLVVMITWVLLWPLDSFLKRRILQRAKALRSKHPEIIAIGITGSVGKTTTKELLAHILSDRAVATPAHVNSEIGVARWMMSQLSAISDQRSGKNQKLNAERSPLVAVVEMGAYRRGEIALLCDIVQPQIGVITFIGSQHLTLFGSQDALCNAKAELLESLPSDGHAFINGDSDLSAGLKNHSRAPVTLIGTGGHADLEAFDIEETPQGLRFRALNTTFTLPLHGTHNTGNALLTIAVARHLGLTLEEMRMRMATFQPPHRTFEMRDEAGVHILDDTHNASAASFSAGIGWARGQPFDQKILLTPGLIELGEEQERTHRELGSLSADVFDRAIFLSKSAADQFARGFGRDPELYGKRTAKVPTGSLLVCIGRMSPSILKSLLP